MGASWSVRHQIHYRPAYTAARDDSRTGVATLAWIHIAKDMLCGEKTR